MQSQERPRTQIVISPGVAGDAMAMLVAVVWFFVGLANSILFIYRPIMFFFGLVAVVRGLFGGAED